MERGVFILQRLAGVGRGGGEGGWWRGGREGSLGVVRGAWNMGYTDRFSKSLEYGLR